MITVLFVILAVVVGYLAMSTDDIETSMWLTLLTFVIIGFAIYSFVA